jgi:hypothetical protein
MIIIMCYVCLHSVSSHKEFRFLLPVLPLCCILSGQCLNSILNPLKPVEDEVTKDSHSNKRQHPAKEYEKDTPIIIRQGQQQQVLRQNRKRKKKTWFIVAMMTVPNLIAVLYLAIVHQRAPISVNREIIRLLSTRQTTPQEAVTVHVHYLTGCHATPLYSFLHSGSMGMMSGLSIDASILECPPSCRSNPNETCQSDAFFQNPLSYVQERYQFKHAHTRPTGIQDSCEDNGNGEMLISPVPHGKDNTDTAVIAEDSDYYHSFPDFVVVPEREALKIDSFLCQNMGLERVAQLKHSLSGVKLIAPGVLFQVLKESCFVFLGYSNSMSLEERERPKPRLRDVIFLEFEYLILYGKPSSRGTRSLVKTKKIMESDVTL